MKEGEEKGKRREGGKEKVGKGEVKRYKKGE